MITKTPLYLNKNILNMNTSAQIPQNHIRYSQDQMKNPTTVDDADVARHTKQLHDWWDLKGPMKGLHILNLLRVPFVRDGISECSPHINTLKPLMSKRILDVGCGGGILSEGLAKLGAEITGIDASIELVTMARNHSCNNPELECNRPLYYCSTVEDHICQFKNYYDAVVASEVIEHVINKELFVRACVAALKPGGKIFFTTPSRTTFTKIFGIYVAEYILNLLPKGTHQYEKLMTPNELKCLLERNGCAVEASYGMFYNILTNKWQWSDSQKLMFAMQALKVHNC